MKMVNVTPDVTRVFSNELINFEGKEQLTIKDYNAVIFNRPKFWVKSFETLWASEFLQMQRIESVFLTAEQKNISN